MRRKRKERRKYTKSHQERINGVYRLRSAESAERMEAESLQTNEPIESDTTDRKLV